MKLLDLEFSRDTETTDLYKLLSKFIIDNSKHQ